MQTSAQLAFEDDESIEPRYRMNMDLEACRNWNYKQTGKISSDFIHTIGLMLDGEMIAVTGFSNFTDKSCQLHFTLKPDAKVSREYIQFVFWYPFVQLGLNVIICMVPDKNEKAVRLVRHLGFNENLHLHDAGLRVFTITKTQCKWVQYKWEIHHGWQ